MIQITSWTRCDLNHDAIWTWFRWYHELSEWCPASCTMWRCLHHEKRAKGESVALTLSKTLRFDITAEHTETLAGFWVSSEAVKVTSVDVKLHLSNTPRGGVVLLLCCSFLQGGGSPPKSPSDKIAGCFIRANHFKAARLRTSIDPIDKR